jgi:hypothetical protein
LEIGQAETWQHFRTYRTEEPALERKIMADNGAPAEPKTEFSRPDTGPAEKHWIWYSRRNHRWRGVVPNVPSVDSKAVRPETPQFGSRSAYRFYQWQANLRVLEVEEIKTVPYAPRSHPFVERLIGTIRHRLLDRTLFWTAADLEAKLLDFKHYYNGHRAHAGLEGRTPEPNLVGIGSPLSFCSYRWQKHCRGLYHTPIAA